jgi:hypothetical protein
MTANSANTPPPKPPTVPGFIRVSQLLVSGAVGSPQPRESSVAFELTLPSGTQVRIPTGFEPDELAVLLELLREPSRS